MPVIEVAYHNFCLFFNDGKEFILYLVQKMRIINKIIKKAHKVQ